MKTTTVGDKLIRHIDIIEKRLIRLRDKEASLRSKMKWSRALAVDTEISVQEMRLRGFERAISRWLLRSKPFVSSRGHYYSWSPEAARAFDSMYIDPVAYLDIDMSRLINGEITIWDYIAYPSLPLQQEFPEATSEYYDAVSGAYCDYLVEAEVAEALTAR